jgi:Ca2+-binding EF-hand superfamily protein
VNGSGSIDFFEIKKAIIDLGLDGRNEMIKEIFWRLDEDMSSVLEFKEFLEMMTTTMILGNDLTKFKNYFLYRKVIS